MGRGPSTFRGFECTGRGPPWRKSSAASPLLLLLGPGCEPKVVNSPEIYNTATLEEVGDLIRSATGANKKPPGSLKDLARNRDLFMNGYTALEKGDIIAYWGVAPLQGDEKAGSDEVLAYKSDVPSKGWPGAPQGWHDQDVDRRRIQGAKKSGKD